MKKICLTVVGMYFLFFHGFSQTHEQDSTAYKSKKLSLSEVSLVSSYYDQTADKSAVMGGDPGPKGIADVTDFANGLDIKFVGWDKQNRKNSLTAGLGIDYHTAASQAYVNYNGTAINYGTRIYPTLEWIRENESKGTTIGIGGYYSAEHNYYHSIGLNTSFSKKTHHNGEFGFKLTGYFDQIKMIYPSEFVVAPPAPKGTPDIRIDTLTTASGQVRYVQVDPSGNVVGSVPKTTIPSRPRDTYTASFSFSQVINTRLDASIQLDLVYQNGYLGLPFHRVYFNTPDSTYEKLPSTRVKLPIGLRINYFLGDNVILKGYYRFYVDSWGLNSQTASLEIPIKITAFFSLSPFYRFYLQNASRYFAPYKVHSVQDPYYTSNYALASFISHFFGMGFRMAPPKGIFVKSLNSMEIRYGHYTQNINLNANIISLNLNFK